MIGYEYARAHKCCYASMDIIGNKQWQRQFADGRDRDIMKRRLAGESLEHVASSYKLCIGRVQQIERAFFRPMVECQNETPAGFLNELMAEPRTRLKMVFERHTTCTK